MKKMQGNRYLLDANAILRFLLQDNEEQFHYVRDVIKAENCYVTLEVLAEVCYDMEKVIMKGKVATEMVAAFLLKVHVPRGRVLFRYCL